ncbi:hypothetical protein [Streptomyces nymphaeiformis]|uniref:Endogenous inhibitor of DNA gyrase (YacG/DUF329 family) n=1 Tax=Streptomyces nymphaeiformis TaxID=2663842 RepID=A0A7W7U8J1_9ACTN|nr:hypothetical protein [Streptomyces nymphaeiformis]MBB4986127.1 endogenous inhibitor of DNA gyrase (YacG/DUF329 family) [Streptomyces nymphaeiformis]
MGSTFQTIADLEATAEEAGALGERVGVWLVAEGIATPEREPSAPDKTWYLPGPRWSHVTDEPRSLGTDGLAVVTGRTVFFGSPGTGGSPICPHCATVVPDRRSSFSRAMDAWWATGVAEVRCPACGRTVPLPAWEWENDFFAFACLGIEHWNGPPLRPAFIAELTEVLGHRTRVLAGRIWRGDGAQPSSRRRSLRRKRLS